jgi:hypothetical protein
MEKKLRGFENKIDDFFKQAFDKHLLNLIESAIIDLANKRHLTPFLFSVSFNLPICYTDLETCEKFLGEGFKLDQKLVSNVAQKLIIDDENLIFLTNLACSRIIASSLNSLKFIELVYFNIKKQTVFNDVQMRTVKTQFLNQRIAFWVNFDVDFFILVKLLIPGSANYFLTAFKRDFFGFMPNLSAPVYRFVNIPCAIVNETSLVVLGSKFDYNSLLANIDMTNFSTMSNPSIFELEVLPDIVEIPNEAKIKFSFPWRSGNAWKNQFFYFFYPEKVMPVMDFSGLNAIEETLEGVIHSYYQLNAFRTSPDMFLPHFNTKNIKKGLIRDSLGDIRIIPNNDWAEELTIDATSRLPASRYLINGFYNDEPLSPFVLINLIRYEFYFNSFAVDLRTKSFFSIFDFKTFIRARVVPDAQQAMQPTVYEAGTTRGVFCVKTLVPVSDLKLKLVRVLNRIRNDYPLEFPMFLNPCDLDRLVSEYGDIVVSMILDNPTEYVWCIIE